MTTELKPTPTANLKANKTDAGRCTYDTFRVIDASVQTGQTGGQTEHCGNPLADYLKLLTFDFWSPIACLSPLLPARFCSESRKRL